MVLQNGVGVVPCMFLVWCGCVFSVWSGCGLFSVEWVWFLVWSGCGILNAHQSHHNTLPLEVMAFGVGPPARLLKGVKW